MDDATWWTAFGAIAQAAGALATLGAVVVALWVSRTERELRGKGSARIMIQLQQGATSGRYHITFSLENTGLRTLTWTNIAWRVGWVRYGPRLLKREMALQNISTGPFIHHVIEPTAEAQEVLPVADFKTARDEQSGPFFERRLPVLGYAPIAAFAIVRGRKPIRLEMSANLRALLRTGEHPDRKVFDSVPYE